jgi:uncharacterized protein YndB with AHSA1/START domain
MSLLVASQHHFPCRFSLQVVKVSVQAVLPYPVERVFDFVADMRNDPQWAPMVTAVELVDGDAPGVGARWRYEQAMGSHTIHMEVTMTEFDRPNRLAWVYDHKSMDYRSSMQFAEVAGGTKIRQTNMEAWHFAPFWLKLVAPVLVRKQLRKQLMLLKSALRAPFE